jgi:hypothetical protein
VDGTLRDLAVERQLENFIFFRIWVPRTVKSTVSRVVTMEPRVGDFLQHAMARRKERGSKTNADVDSDVHPLDKLNQEAIVDLLVHFEAIRTQRAFQVFRG